MSDIDLTGMVVDDAEFQMALSAYAYACGKELPDVLNKVGRDIALRAAGQAGKADKGAIQRVEDDVVARKNVGKFVYVAQQLGMLKRPIASGKGWRQRATAEFRRMFARRRSAVGMVAGAWVKVARAIERNGAGSLGYFKRGQDAGKGWARPATASAGDSDIVCVLEVAYDNRNKHDTIMLGFDALQKAKAFKAGDMWTYVSRKMGEIAARYSAGGA